MDETSFLNRKHASNSPVTFFTCKCFAVLFFLPSRCVNSLIWSKGSTEKQPAVRTSSTRSQPAWKISSKVDTREARVRSGSRVLARSRATRRTCSQANSKVVCSPIFRPKANVYHRYTAGNVKKRNSPVRVAGNERFLAPCPNYILSPDAVISRVDTALVRGQISLDLGWLSR